MKRQGLKTLFTTGVATATLLAASPAMAAVDMFLKVDGVVGESQSDKHKGDIDVLSWSWGQSTGTARTGRGTQPATCIQDLSVTKWIDAATPALIMNGVTAAVAPAATLTVERPGSLGGPREYLRLTMRNVTVTSLSTGGSGGEDRLTETITLHFESMEGQYRRQNPDGTLGAPITWEVTAGNAGCR